MNYLDVALAHGWEIQAECRTYDDHEGGHGWIAEGIIITNDAERGIRAVCRPGSHRHYVCQLAAADRPHALAMAHGMASARDARGCELGMDHPHRAAWFAGYHEGSRLLEEASAALEVKP